MNTTPAPIIHARQGGKTAQQEAYEAEKAALDAAVRREAMIAHPTAPKPVKAPNGKPLSDLVTRLIARHDKRQETANLSPVRRTIREQVRSLVQGFAGGTPTPERNRQAYVDAMATKVNHLGQVSHVYPGTVDPKTIAHRRARNRQSRVSRRINRAQRRG